MYCRIMIFTLFFYHHILCGAVWDGPLDVLKNHGLPPFLLSTPSLLLTILFSSSLSESPSYLVCNGEKQSPRRPVVDTPPPQAPSRWFHPQNQTGTRCERPSNSCKREEEDVTRLQQRIYQLTSTTCEPGNGNSHHCLHYRFAVLQLASSLAFFFFTIIQTSTASGISRSCDNTQKISKFFPQDNISHFIWWNNSWESFKKKPF